MQNSIKLAPNPKFVESYKMASLTISYSELVEVLGQPTNTQLDVAGKTQADWNLRDSIGRKVCVWDYKTKCSPEDNTHWSVFGDRYLLGQLFGDKLQYLP